MNDANEPAEVGGRARASRSRRATSITVRKDDDGATSMSTTDVTVQTVARPAREDTFRDRFDRIAERSTQALGSMPALVGSVVLVIVWALTGPIFGFSDTWQLFINTTTTVITFWMVFVIQNSANRQSKATNLKLDELIRSAAEARNEFVTMDGEPETVLVERKQEFLDLVEPIEVEPTEPEAPGRAP